MRQWFVCCMVGSGACRDGRGQFDAIASGPVTRGYTVWNVGYGRVGESARGWPGTMQDVALAIDHLVALVNEGIDLDLDRVVATGHSAGGQLAMCVTTRGREGVSRMLMHSRPIAVAGLAAVVYFERAHELDSGDGAVRAFLGATPEQMPKSCGQASPAQLLPLGVPQLILHVTRDNVLPIELAERYVAHLRACGDWVEFSDLPNTGHMDYLDPSSDAHAAFCDRLARTARR